MSTSLTIDTSESITSVVKQGNKCEDHGFQIQQFKGRDEISSPLDVISLTFISQKIVFHLRFNKKINTYSY